MKSNQIFQDPSGRRKLIVSIILDVLAFLVTAFIGIFIFTIILTPTLLNYGIKNITNPKYSLITLKEKNIEVDIYNIGIDKKSQYYVMAAIMPNGWAGRLIGAGAGLVVSAVIAGVATGGVGAVVVIAAGSGAFFGGGVGYMLEPSVNYQFMPPALIPVGSDSLAKLQCDDFDFLPES